MLESILTGLGVLFLYKLAHDFMLQRMIEDAKKPPKEGHESLPG